MYGFAGSNASSRRGVYLELDFVTRSALLRGVPRGTDRELAAGSVAGDDAATTRGASDAPLFSAGSDFGASGATFGADDWVLATVVVLPRVVSFPAGIAGVSPVLAAVRERVTKNPSATIASTAAAKTTNVSFVGYDGAQRALCNSEIRKPAHPITSDEDVRGRDVAMKDAERLSGSVGGFVRRVQACESVERDAQHDACWNPASFPRNAKEPVHGFALDVIENEKRPLFVDSRVMQPDDVRVVHLCRHPRFIEETSAGALRGRTRVPYSFNRDEALAPILSNRRARAPAMNTPWRIG